LNQAGQWCTGFHECAPEFRHILPCSIWWSIFWG
jgi:hypothetical protein